MSLDTAQGSADSPPSPPPGRPAPPTVPPTGRMKERRRPLLFALMAALVAAGALLAAYAYTAVSDSESVLVVTNTVHRGEVIDADDIRVAQVSHDPALQPIPGSELQDIVGQRAAMDLAAGGLVTRDAVTDEVVPGSGESLVGVSLTPAQMPAEPLYAGDQVRIVATPGDQGEVSDRAPVTVEASVVGVRTSEETGETVVDLVLPHDLSAQLAAMAATRKIALVLDERER